MRKTQSIQMIRSAVRGSGMGRSLPFSQPLSRLCATTRYDVFCVQSGSERADLVGWFATSIPIASFVGGSARPLADHWRARPVALEFHGLLRAVLYPVEGDGVGPPLGESLGDAVWVGVQGHPSAIPQSFGIA
jgi:hypothetical protein